MKLLRYAKNCIVRIYFSVVYEFFRLTTKVVQNKVLMISDVREKLEGNLAYVWNYLDDDAYLKTTYLKGDRRNRSSIRTFNKMAYDFATSKYVLLEDYFRYTSYVRLKEGQEICQLWHACGAYKKFGYSRSKGNEHIKIHKGYKKYTKVTVSSENIRENYAEAFGISLDKVQAKGVPRTDLFFDEKLKKEKREKLYKSIPAIHGKKVILFAPTYRGIRAEDAYYDFDCIDYSRLYEEFRDEYVFIIKWHPALFNNLKRKDTFSKYIEPYNDFFLDLSGEREVNDLLLISDLLITDYSSVIFEYSLLEKPIIYFAYDIEKYGDMRGLYHSFETYVYGEVARNNDELIDAIKKHDLKADLRKDFCKRYMDACDGKSTQRVCDWIFGD